MSFQPTLSTHIINLFSQHILSPLPINLSSQHTLFVSTYPINLPSHHFLSTYSLNTFYQLTLSTGVHGDSYSQNHPNNQQAEREVPVAALMDYCAQTKARVICVGDVHGCLEELQDLLREVDYHPGDLVLLLGDLVAKGPHSTEVRRQPPVDAP